MSHAHVGTHSTADRHSGESEAFGHVELIAGHSCAHCTTAPVGRANQERANQDNPFGRRAFLGAATGMGMLAAMPKGLLTRASNDWAATGRLASARRAAAARTGQTRLVLLGTAGGPPAVKGRAGIATALVVGDNVYLIDMGRASASQFANAGLNPNNVKGIFITHSHLDHIADLFNFFAMNLFGLTGFPALRQTIPIYGPGPGGPGALRFPVANPIGGGNPAPGTGDIVADFEAAYAYHMNEFKGAPGAVDVRSLVDVHEIPLPTGVMPRPGPPPPTAPFPVFENDDVKVTATLVPHIFSSFAFRFDTSAGSFVMSGDTGSSSQNLIRLAKDADVLVHEVIDLDAPGVLANIPPALLPTVKTLQSQTHTPVKDVGPIAQQAGAKHLVLNHYVPGGVDAVSARTWRSKAKAGYDGTVLAGEDLMEIGFKGRSLPLR